MTLRDSYGEITATIGERFQIGDSTLEIVCPIANGKEICCRVVTRAVAVDEGLMVGPGSPIHMNPAEICGLIRQYRLTGPPAIEQEPARSAAQKPDRRPKAKPPNAKDHNRADDQQDLFGG